MDELLEMLHSAPGYGFEDSIQRVVVFSRAKALAKPEALAFFRAALEHADLPWFVKKELAAEIVGQSLSELAPLLESLAEEVPGLGLEIEALAAISEGDRCSCEVYMERKADGPGPRMTKLRDLPTEDSRERETLYRCEACGSRLVHRRQHHERGPTFHSWRRR